jgi:membrane protease YdiL (CAAX protease family)
MNNTQKTIFGILLTAAVYLASVFIGRAIHLDNKFVPSSFPAHTLMLIFSVSAIFAMKNQVYYKIALPKLKLSVMPIVYAVVTTILVNLIISLVIKITGGKIEVHPLLVKLSPLQVFLFVFIYASTAEELLFRGFLVNILKPLKEKGISLFRIRISLSAIIGALMFAAAHLSLIGFGMNLAFMIRIEIFTFSLGLIAGYYQEKYDNNAYAIMVHMAGNSIAVIAAFSMS